MFRHDTSQPAMGTRTGDPPAPTLERVYEAIFFDFGGVIVGSPFEAFNRYEATNGLPKDFIRRVNSVNSDTNAWALLERNEISPEDFDGRFADESLHLGHRVPGSVVLELIHGDVRPEMVAALDLLKAHDYAIACLTNNVVSGRHDDQRTRALAPILARFDHVIESSKVGARKPERRFYEIACERAGVEPDRCVFLDDLGINLKTARHMGMVTIKVISGTQALTDLAAVLQLPTLIDLTR
jgi:putative hydrolase of the HAD superfamily